MLILVCFYEIIYLILGIEIEQYDNKNIEGPLWYCIQGLESIGNKSNDTIKATI